MKTGEVVLVAAFKKFHWARVIEVQGDVVMVHVPDWRKITKVKSDAIYRRVSA